MRPLDRVGAIKAKLGLVLAGAVAATVVVVVLAQQAGVSPWLAGAGAFVVALGVVQVLAHGMTLPLRELARQADHLAAGEPVEPVRATARDEVGRLTVAFNRMAVEVAATDRLRRDLVANVSHELRTPLAALRAVLENLADGVAPLDPDTVRDLLGQVERLGRLVDDVLDLSRLEAGAAELRVRNVPLAALLARAAAEVDAGAHARVEVDVQPADLAVHGDPDRLHQVVVNLVANALRHGPPGTPVRVRAAADAGGVVLRVEDAGPGVAPDQAEQVFERFHRSDTGRAASAGGSGLGLAITRWIVDLHGGDVAVERPGEPGGRFVVRLPPEPIPTPATTTGQSRPPEPRRPDSPPPDPPPPDPPPTDPPPTDPPPTDAPTDTDRRSSP